MMLLVVGCHLTCEKFFMLNLVFSQMAIVMMCFLCRLSAMLVYCEKMAEVRIMPFSLECSSMPAKFDEKI